MKFLFLITSIFFAGNLFSQDISGEWIGEIFMKDKKGKYTLYFPVAFELNTDSITKKISGTNVTKSFDTLIAECTVTGDYNSKKEIYIITEITATYSNKMKDGMPFTVLNRFYLSFTNTPEEKLTGTVDCITPGHSYLCNEKLKIELRRYASK